MTRLDPLRTQTVALMVAATRRDPQLMDHLARALVLEWGAAGVDQAVRLTAGVGARNMVNTGSGSWTPDIDADQHPAMTCAKRIIAAAARADTPTVDALLAAARQHRYQLRLLLSIAALTGDIARAGGVVR